MAKNQNYCATLYIIFAFFCMENTETQIDNLLINEKQSCIITLLYENISGINMKKHQYYIDLLRVLACFLVIVNHTVKDAFIGYEMDFSATLGMFYLTFSKIAVDRKSVV